MNLISKAQKIFIAGHKGMVGNAIFKLLIKNGYENLIFAEKNFLDLTSENQVKDFFKKNRPEIVILAAAKVGGIVANNTYPYEFLLENLKIQNNLINTSFQEKVRRILFLGSSCIYPREAIQPIQEEALLTGPLENTNECYAIAKIAGIKLCNALRKEYGLDAISVMPTNLYGPGDNYNLQNSHVIPALLRKFHEAKLKNEISVKCWGSGNPLREFLHVEDLAKACLFILENYESNSNKFKELGIDKIGYLNVGTGTDISIKELALLISDIVGYRGDTKWDLDKPDGTFRKRLDITKIEQLGWSPKIKLREGLLRTYKEFKIIYEENNFRQ